MTAHPIFNLLGSPKDFLDKIFQHLANDRIEVSNLEMDHICYRVNSIEHYEELSGRLSKHGEMISKKHIGGRPISVFDLRDPIFYKDRTLKILELPAPKKGRPYQQGFEHIEFVVPSDLKTFMDRYPLVQWESKDINKPINADIRVIYASGSVKFHCQSLKYVINHLDE